MREGIKLMLNILFLLHFFINSKFEYMHNTLLIHETDHQYQSSEKNTSIIMQTIFLEIDPFDP